MAHLSTNQHLDEEYTFNFEELTSEEIGVLREALQTFRTSIGVDKESCNIEMIKKFILHKSAIGKVLFDSLDLEDV